MENIGRKLTDEGIENVKKLDTNKDGKLDTDEVDVDDASDYAITVGSCHMCRITECSHAFSCTHGYPWGR